MANEYIYYIVNHKVCKSLIVKSSTKKHCKSYNRIKGYVKMTLN